MCVCVLSQDQYQFVFEAVLTFLESFETYSNFKWHKHNIIYTHIYSETKIADSIMLAVSY